MKKIILLSCFLVSTLFAFSQNQAQQKPIPIDVKNKSLDVKISNKKIPVIVYNAAVPLNVHVVDTNILKVKIMNIVDSSKTVFSFVKTENLTNAILIIPKPGFEAMIDYIGFEGVDQSGKLQLATKAILSYYNHSSLAPFDAPVAQFPVANGNCSILIKAGNAAKINIVLPDELRGTGYIYVYGHQQKLTDYVD